MKFVDALEESGQNVDLNFRKRAKAASFTGTGAKLDLFRLRLTGHRGVNLIHQIEKYLTLSFTGMWQRNSQIGDNSPGIFVHDDDAIRHEHRFFNIVRDHQDSFRRDMTTGPQIEEFT